MDLFNNSSLGDELGLLGQQFSPIANTKYDSAAADQSSRQADTRHKPAATVQSFQRAGTRHKPASVAQFWRTSPNQPQVRLLEWQAATGNLRAVLGWVSLSVRVITRWVQQGYVRWTNTCLLLAKTSKAEQTEARLGAVSHCPWVVFMLLHQAPFHVSAIAKHPFPCVCFRKSLSCVCFGKTSFAIITFQRTVSLIFSKI